MDIALLPLVAAAFRDPWLLLWGVTFTVFAVLSTIPHELSHALVARALGLHVSRITIGFGRTIWRGTLGGFLVQVNAVPLGGRTQVSPRTRTGARTRVFLTALAGPAANLALAAGGFFLFRSTIAREHFHRFAPATAFVWANAWAMVLNLLPFQIQSATGQTWSDGGMLITVPFWRRARVDLALAGYFAARAVVCREAKDYAGAHQWLREGLSRFPENDLLGTNLSVTLLGLGEYEEARAQCRGMLARVGLKPEVRAIVLNNIAYADYLLDRPDLLGEADSCSADALALLPWQSAVLGTRGAVLVALGRAAEALPLLQRALSDRNRDDRSRALNSCSLALAMLQLGDRDGAEAMAATARRLDPDCALLGRAVAALTDAPRDESDAPRPAAVA